MTKHMKEVVQRLRALRPEMHNAAGTRAVEELDWAIEQIETEIAAVEAGGNQRESSQRCLAYLGHAIRNLPWVVTLIRSLIE